MVCTNKLTNTKKTKNMYHSTVNVRYFNLLFLSIVNARLNFFWSKTSAKYI